MLMMVKKIMSTELQNNRKAIIVDLDGTLCDTSHRMHFIKDGDKVKDEPDWEGFSKACLGDRPIDAVLDLLHAMDADAYQILLLTGRSRIAEVETLNWLNSHDIPWNECSMRHFNDIRPDIVIKKEHYEKNIKPYYDVLFVLEDRDRVVDMWRELGLNCFQVAKGEY